MVVSAFTERNACRESRCAKPVSSCPRSYSDWVSDGAARRGEPAAPAALGAAGLRAARHGAERAGAERAGTGRRSRGAALGSLPAGLPARTGQLALLRGKSRLAWKEN